MKSLLDSPDGVSAHPSASPRQSRSPAFVRAAEALGAVFLLLVGAYLRLSHIDIVQYREDDDALWNIVTKTVRTGRFPLTGMHSSIGLPNGPFQVLLLVPFGWIGASPPLMTAAVGLLNVLGLAFVYGFTRDFFGRRVALLALLLVAVNPWAVVLSRRLWGDDMVAPFAALTLWSLCRWLFRRDGRAAVIAGMALAVVTQVYIVALSWLIVTAVAVVLAGKQAWSRWTASALVVVLLLSGPYAIGAALPRLHALSAIDQPITGATPVIDLTAVHFALELASNEGYQSFALQDGGVLDATSGFAGFLGLLARLCYLLGLAVGIGCVARGAGRLAEERRGVHLLLILSVLAPVVVLLRHAVPVYPYYLVSSFPAPYVYSAVGIDALWRLCARFGAARERMARAVVGAGVAAIVAADVVLAAIFFVSAGQYWQRGNYGMPWRMVDQLALDARRIERSSHATQIFVPEHNEDPNVLFRVLRQRGAAGVEFDDRRMLVLSNEPTLYLVMGNDRAQRYLATAFGGDLVASERLAGDGTVVRFYLLPAGTASAPLPADIHPSGWRLGNLVRLDGVALPARIVPGRPVAVTTVTTILEQPNASIPNFSIFAHLVRANGTAVAQHDEPAWPTDRWRAGDRVIQWIGLDPPATARPGLLALLVGMYSMGSPGHLGITPLPVTDAGGKPLGASAPAAGAVIAPPSPGAAEHPLVVHFADAITLDGYDIAEQGARLTLTLHWAAGAAVPRNYTAFVHVVDAAGRQVAQNDGQPAGGQFPTSYWRPGDRIADAHSIVLPATLPSGRYRLEIGLYELATLQRLAVVSGQPEATVALPLIGHATGR